MRFGNPSSFLEVQSFGEGRNFKAAFLLVNDKFREATFSETSKGEGYSIEEFITEFLHSSPDKNLTLQRLSVEGNNPKDIQEFSTY